MGEVGAQRRVRGCGPSLELRPLTPFALDDASHRQEQIDLSPLGRGNRAARTGRFHQKSSHSNAGGGKIRELLHGD